MIAQMFIPTAELVIPTETQTNEANVGTETQLVLLKLKKTSVQHYLNNDFFYSLNHYDLFHLKQKFLHHLFFYNLNPRLDIFVLKILMYYFIIYIAIRRK